MKKAHKKQTDQLQKFGNNLRAARKATGLTQEQLADSLQLSVAYVSLLERGGRNPPLTTVLHLADALGVMPRALVE